MNKLLSSLSADKLDAVATVSHLEDILRGPGFPLSLSMGQFADQKDHLSGHV